MENPVPVVVQIVIFGLLSGSIYSLFALGLTLVMGAARILNLSHGDLGILGAYFAYWLFATFSVDPIVSLVVVVPVIAMVGMGVQRYLINPAISDPRFRIIASVMITYGLALLISNGETIIWTPGYKFVNLSYSYRGFEILGTMVNFPRLLVLVTSAAVAICLMVFLRTRVGKAIQASAQDQMLAELVGINCNRIAVITFSVSASLACIGGVLYILNNPLYPAVGLGLSVKGLTVMVLGGIGNVPGALIGGLLLGLAESSTSFFLGDIYREVVTYAVLVTILLMRPGGIFGSFEN